MIAWWQAAGPPTSEWEIPREVSGVIWQWMQIALYVTLAGAIVAVIMFGALMAIDRDRGEPVSATSPAVRAFRIALGVLVMTSATSLASWFI